MSAPQRTEELERFRSASDMCVMLFSLSAGSTGLNLTVRGQESILGHCFLVPAGLSSACCCLTAQSCPGPSTANAALQDSKIMQSPEDLGIWATTIWAKERY